jgi:hypothetical protein
MKVMFNEFDSTDRFSNCWLISFEKTVASGADESDIIEKLILAEFL